MGEQHSQQMARGNGGTLEHIPGHGVSLINGVVFYEGHLLKDRPLGRWLTANRRRLTADLTAGCLPSLRQCVFGQGICYHHISFFCVKDLPAPQGPPV